MKKLFITVEALPFLLFQYKLVLSYKIYLTKMILKAQAQITYSNGL